jgi:glycosyltransferase involved in cell wall biosynthesis
VKHRRLLFLNNQGLGAPGGGPEILRELAAALAAEHEITIVSDDAPTGAAVREVQLRAFPHPADLRWRFKPWLRAQHLRGALDPRLIAEADLVIALDPHFSRALARTAARRLLHLSLSCVTRQERFGGSGSAQHWYPPQYALLERWLASHAQAIIVASHTHAEELVRFTGAPRERIRVMSPVFPHRRSPAAPASARDLVVALGRITTVKNLDALLPLLALLPALRLSLIGDGDRSAALQAQAVSLGVAERIDWHGQVNGVDAWLARTQLLLHPSRYESFGMAVHEAMRAGAVPVVFSRGPGRHSAATELVRHGVDGLHVDFDDPASAASAIGSLLASPQQLSAMSQAARAAAARRDEFDYLARFRALLAEITEAP